MGFLFTKQFLLYFDKSKQEKNPAKFNFISNVLSE